MSTAIQTSPYPWGATLPPLHSPTTQLLHFAARPCSSPEEHLWDSLIGCTPFQCLCSFSWQPHGSLDFKCSWRNHESQTQVSTLDHSSSATKSFKDSCCKHVSTWALDNHHSSFIPKAASLTVFTSKESCASIFQPPHPLSPPTLPLVCWAIYRSLTHWEPSKWTSFYATSHQQKDFLDKMYIAVSSFTQNPLTFCWPRKRVLSDNTALRSL